MFALCDDGGLFSCRGELIVYVTFAWLLGSLLLQANDGGSMAAWLTMLYIGI